VVRYGCGSFTQGYARSPLDVDVVIAVLIFAEIRGSRGFDTIELAAKSRGSGTGINKTGQRSKPEGCGRGVENNLNYTEIRTQF
jgi:hypothetical protein